MPVVVLLIFVFAFSVSTSAPVMAQMNSMNAMTSNTTGSPVDTGALNSQISQLQHQLQVQQQRLKQLEIKNQQFQIKHFQEIRSQLYTQDLPTPTLPSQAYDKIKNCNPNQTQPAINSTAFNNWWKTYLTDFHCGHVVVPFPSNHTALREFKLIFDDNQGFGNYVSISKNATDPVMFPAWHINNTVPAPTIRVTQGDHVRLTVINSNNSKFPHSLHMHSIHSGPMDGMFGEGGAIAPGHSFTYDFIARPYGDYLYHCHMEPVQQHIQRGLYGLLIIDPPVPRPPAKELVMMMNGYSFNQINLQSPNNDAPLPLLPPTAQALREGTADIGSTGIKKTDTNNNAAADNNNAVADIPKVLGEVPKADSATIKNQDKAMKDAQDVPQATGTGQQDDQQDPNQAKDDALDPGGGEGANDNQFYTVNGKTFGYEGPDMIKLQTGQPYRIYLANMVEFDPSNSFHLHGNMFGYIPSGTAMAPKFVNDILLLGQGDRGILEFTYHLPGLYMFHAHINRFSSLGWVGVFHVVKANSNAITPQVK